MRERPILFSAPMIRAILDGSKTQTRRVVKSDVKRRAPGDPWYTDHVWSMRAPSGVWEDYTHDGFMALCPYGRPGDRLWVRETWAALHACDAMRPGEIPRGAAVVYAATADLGGPRGMGGLMCRSPLYMPRWASRITLEVTDVRVERLHDISEEDARAEGIDWSRPEPHGEKWSDDDREDPREVGYPPAGASFARDNFRRLWSSINGAASWWDNPFVWRIEFRRLA